MNKNKKNIWRSEKGFSLLETIGVLAIMAIFAAVVTPNVVKQIQAARQDAEEESISRLADGLSNYVLENRIIPQSGYGIGTWSASIASQTDLPDQDVYQNDLNCARRYWFDPSTNINGLSGGSGLYNQNTVTAANLAGYTTGSTAAPPVNPRAMIISDTISGCTNNINGVADTDANFNAVWNQASSPLVESKSLKINRINFSQLFKTVTLSNEVPITLPAAFQYKLEGQAGNTTINITSPSSPNIVSFNVIDGTTLYLYDQSGVLLRSVVIKESEGFTYVQGPPALWNR